jgi:hypothetical protein
VLRNCGIITAGTINFIYPKKGICHISFTMSQSGNESWDADEAYCSISEAMKLINQPFEGDKKKLKEFIDNVSTAFELVRPGQHELLLKFVKN